MVKQNSDFPNHAPDYPKLPLRRASGVSNTEGNMIAGLSVGGATAVSAILVAIVIYGDLEGDTDKWLLAVAAFFLLPLVAALVALGAKMFGGR